ncbi:hypothetical protein FLAN108750_06320 [Flavobacterium antarcticum]|uniref:hypothetical protein n=1 Tax=Flavobacterium antarcticum TaxID=271155 RepID=UPI0003B47972|nr:hypothetical protein [Flavobacterium antarcticum]
MKTKGKTFKVNTILILIAMTLYSCNFSKSVEKDLSTGAFSSADGISSDKVIIEVNGKNDNRTDYAFGDKINLVFENVEGLTKSDGKVFPGLSVIIVKNEKDTLLSSPDLLKDFNNGTALSPLKLNANFSAAFPSKSGDKFMVHVKIYDKKGKGTFNYELPFTVKESDLLRIKNNGLTYSNIYLWNETLKEPVLNNSVNSDHLLILILDGVEGMEPINGKVFPVFSLNLTDNIGNAIISSPNILSSIENVGASAADLKKQVTAKITITKGTFNNPWKLSAKLKDKNSEKEILIETELVIE